VGGSVESEPGLEPELEPKPRLDIGDRAKVRQLQAHQQPHQQPEPQPEPQQPQPEPSEPQSQPEPQPQPEPDGLFASGG
jgi:hypothetical protein